MRYKTHEIAYGDTLEYISQEYYGTPIRWYEIVEFNNLEYPYIVYSDEEKKTNVEGLVTLGDIIRIPDTSGEIDPNSLTKEEKLDIIGVVMGKDISTITNSNYYESFGNSTEIMDFGSSNGDLATVTGAENVKQAIINRLLTPLGSLLLHPEYGSSLHNIIGTPIVDGTPLIIDDEITKTILKDSRIANVIAKGSKIENDKYTGKFICELQGFEYVFELYITNSKDNIYIS